MQGLALLVLILLALGLLCAGCAPADSGSRHSAFPAATIYVGNLTVVYPQRLRDQRTATPQPPGPVG